MNEIKKAKKFLIQANFSRGIQASCGRLFSAQYHPSSLLQDISIIIISKFLNIFLSYWHFLKFLFLTFFPSNPSWAIIFWIKKKHELLLNTLWVSTRTAISGTLIRPSVLLNESLRYKYLKKCVRISNHVIPLLYSFIFFDTFIDYYFSIKSSQPRGENIISWNTIDNIKHNNLETFCYIYFVTLIWEVKPSPPKPKMGRPRLIEKTILF